MSEASFASLNPALLARKGGAKPAMRPQLAPLPQDPAAVGALAEDQLEDLGWNDMGSEDGASTEKESADVVSITGKAANEDVGDNASPVVRRQQKSLSERVLADAALPAADEAKPKKTKAGAKKGKRAAFTLRLDAERHLKLRLATTMKGVSAQALVTEALDALLDQFEELDALAERMKRD
ncbi:hypothetical protein [Erythrobacter sp. THAF29]|uniref:hypothetical protein n=1 Tax=Erythrobacter sp. THAF29 TaxID=2587851 RepID=UPI00126880D5|nr:hypothetical protein [Erythrobacter sp. THAF29]QFT76937.1 hypothetical protein FIU90_05230 [Erythrobacter sp. THAF29]